MLVLKKDRRNNCEKVRVSGEEMEKVDNFKCLGYKGMGKYVIHRLLDGRKVWGRWESFGRRTLYLK